MTDPTRADVCVVACAEAWRGDGEIVASPMGIVPRLGALLARATFEPDLLITDGEASLITADGTVEGWLPFRSIFDVVASGRRHVMMGASQLDRFGSSNISAVGDWRKPKVQLLGSRGAPGNTINHPTSYWVPNHSPRVFVEEIDFVSGIGWDRGAQEIRRVVTNLGVFDFPAPGRTMRIRSLHPGVSIEEVVAATGFAVEVPPGAVEVTRAPTSAERRLICEVLDPDETRFREVAR